MAPRPGRHPTGRGTGTCDGGAAHTRAPPGGLPRASRTRVGVASFLLSVAAAAESTDRRGRTMRPIKKEGTMSRGNDIREGMQVYGANDQVIGKVERIHGDGFHVNGQHYSRDMVARVAQNRVYLSGTGVQSGRAATGTGQTTEGAIRVPVAEERLTVGKREAELGEVAIRKTVTEEERTVPVTLMHEEVHVEERTVTERPATGDDLFKEQLIRVALRGEEAVITKEAFVTGEVVVEKDQIVEERQITDTVRKQRVDVDKSEVTTRTGGTEVR